MDLGDGRVGRRTGVTWWAWLGFLGGLTTMTAACGADAPQEDAPPREAASQSTSVDASPSGPAWRAEYTAERLAALDEAVERFTEYEELGTEFWGRAGLDPDARDFFAEYWLPPGDENIHKTYRLTRATNYLQRGVSESFWVKPLRIETAGDRDVVVFRSCVDPTTFTVIRDGEEVDRSDRKPHVKIVRMVRDAAGSFLIDDVEIPGPSTAPQLCDPKDVD